MTGTAPVDVADDNAAAHERPTTHRNRTGLLALGAAIVGVVATSIARVVTLGSAPIGADDALYIGVGRELWSFREPLTADGGVFTIRSWVYPLMTGGMSHLFDGSPFGSGDPFTGPRILGWVLGTTALVLAVVLAYRFARGPGAVATALVLLATPLLWTVVPSTMVDVALMCFVVAVLLVLDRPTPGRMLVGGVLSGLALLVKETSALFVVLPLAYLGALPRAEWRRLSLRYLIAFAVTVGWWFVVVLVLKGQIFPLEGFQQSAGRDRTRVWSLDLSGLLLVAAFGAGWLVVAIGRRHEPRGRLLVLAALAFVPAAIVAWYQTLAMRQFSALVLLSCIALGVAVVDVLAALIRRAPRRAGPGIAAFLAIVLVVVALVPIVLAQDRTSVAASPAEIEQEITTWIANRPGEPLVVSTFVFKVQVWSLLTGRATIAPLAFDNQRDAPDLAPAVWVDVRQERYHVLARQELAHQVRGADYLLLTGPHQLGPIALATWLQLHGAAIGIKPVAHFGPRSGSPWGYIYRLQRPRVDAIPSIVSTTAAEQMVADGNFHPVEPMVIAGTRGGFIRLGRAIPIDTFEQLPAPLR
jgi:hypothetical protein